MTKAWEYMIRIEKFSGYPITPEEAINESTKVLNVFGLLGWELVGISNGVMYFKKEVIA